MLKEICEASSIEELKQVFDKMRKTFKPKHGWQLPKLELMQVLVKRTTALLNKRRIHRTR